MGNSNKIPTKPNNFIIKHNQSNPNTITDISSFDQRRTVFVSVIGLYNTWHKCPSVILHSAIFFLPLKKNWIYNPTKYINEIKQRDEIFSLLHKESRNRKKFIKLLKWKDSQGLVFWLLDEQNYDNNQNDLFASSWYSFSDKLTSLYDPVTQQKYKPLILDKKFWTQIYDKESSYQSKYGAKAHSVLAELYCLSLSMQYKCVQEIICQSNPKSLNPIISYDVDQIASKYNNAVINGDDGWTICSDYE